MILTREEAVNLHRKMWTEMREELGNTLEQHNYGRNPRAVFKERWCKEHFPSKDIKHDCLLCEYAVQQLQGDDRYEYDGDKYCQHCPIEWPHSENISAYFCECGEVMWSESPISDILALPERKENK